MSYSELPGEWRRELGATAAVKVLAARPGENDASARRVVDRMFRWSPAFIPFARITWVAIALALLSLVVTLGLVLTGKRVALPVMPTTTAVLGLAAALIGGCVFVATFPGPPGYLGVGPGFWALGLGVVTGLLAAIKLSASVQAQSTDWEP